MKNSYFKALSGLFALCALLVGGGCDDSDSEVNEKPYAISVSQNEMAAYYKIKAPTAAGAGETVSVEVEVTSENHYPHIRNHSVAHLARFRISRLRAFNSLVRCSNAAI